MRGWPWATAAVGVAWAVDAVQQRWAEGERPSYHLHVEAMWAAALPGVPAVNRLSGQVPPPGWDFEASAGPRASGAEVLAALERWMQRHGQSAEGVCVLPAALGR